MSLCGAVVVEWALLVRADAVRYGRGGLAHCYCATIVASLVKREQEQRRRCCVAVACGNLGNLPPPAVGCRVAVFASCSVAAAIATAYGSV